MTSVIYASILGFLIVWLSLNVIKVRRTYKISMGDGGNDKLKVAMVAHTNAIETIPIALLLLFVLEYNQANILLVHLLGVAFITSRFIHAKAILSDNLKLRILGMKVTIFSIIFLGVVNIIYFPYEKLL